MPIAYTDLVDTLFPKSFIADIDACRSLQNEELEVLEAIYPECIVSKSNGILNLVIPIEFGTPRFLKITGGSLPPSATSVTETLFINVLPPILLNISLPPSYPLFCRLDIVSIQATHEWLPNISALEPALIRTWEAGEIALCNWVEYVRSGDFLQEMEFISLSNDVTVELPHSDPLILASLLSEYHTSFNHAQFSQNSYACSICLTYLKGIKCLQLQCSHIFCRSCLEDFWQMCIAEGDVSRVGCPDPVCVKDGMESCEEEVARVVSESEVRRWRRLRTKRDLERDPTTMNCPIPTCQALVPKPGDADPESGWDRFRQCQQCFFSFCSFCKNTW